MPKRRIRSDGDEKKAAVETGWREITGTGEKYGKFQRKIIEIIEKGIEFYMKTRYNITKVVQQW